MQNKSVVPLLALRRQSITVGMTWDKRQSVDVQLRMSLEEVTVKGVLFQSFHPAPSEASKSPLIF